MYYLFLAQGIPGSLAASLGPWMRRNSLYIRVKGYTHRHMGKRISAHTPLHTLSVMDEYLCCWKKKQTVFKVTYRAAFKDQFLFVFY